MNSTVRMLARRSLAASSIPRRRSATPEETALRDTKLELVMRAMISASVVLPDPGGPHRMIELSWSRSMGLEVVD